MSSLAVTVSALNTDKQNGWFSAVELLWKYFHQDKTYYKSDKTHKNAWCKGCLNARKRAMIELDTSKVRGGLITAVRSELELEKAG